MRILVASRIPTDPPTQGNTQCTGGWSRMLEEMGHEVWFLWAYNPWNVSDSDIQAMRARWGERLVEHRCGLRDRAREAVLRRWIARTGGSYRRDQHLPLGIASTAAALAARLRFDAVVANYYVMTGVFRWFPGARRLVYTHDVFTDLLARTGSNWLTTTRGEEGAALDRADVVLSIQESESEFLRSVTKRPVVTAYTPFAIHPTPAAPGGASTLLFLGGPLRWNVEGIREFATGPGREIHRRRPDFRLAIGGGVCAGLGDAADLPFVDVLGRVDSLEAFYARGVACVNPVRNGTGLKIKSVEALAHGKALLCHPHSAEGLPDKEAAPIHVWRDEDEAVEACCRILSSPDSAESRAALATAWVEGINRRCRDSFEGALRA